jgi:hypothetical protein
LLPFLSPFSLLLLRVLQCGRGGDKTFGSVSVLGLALALV